MVVLIVWAVVAGGSLLLLGVLAYGLFGHFRRLQRAVTAAAAELGPAAAALQAQAPRPPAAPGRHRAG